MMLIASDAWRLAFPGAVVGALVMRGVRNPERSDPLEDRKRQLEHDLRAGGADSVESNPRVRVYADHYRAHGKTFHVKAQWESVAVKGKPIPTRAALVEAMFMAELQNLLLTAGHDLATVAPPVEAAVTREGDGYVAPGGKERVLGSGDMMMADREGIISSVLYGPDQRTRITPGTREVLFAVYAPDGIGERAVRDHLEDIRANVLLVAPEADAEPAVTLPAGVRN